MRSESLDFLKSLLAAPSPSGYEQPAAAVYRDYVTPFADEVRTDVMGSVCAKLAGTVQNIDLSTVAVFFVLNFAAISVMIYSLLWYFAQEKNKLRAQVDQYHEELRIEKDRSDKLLLNILPPAIAERLKRNEVNIAQGHADVTVMFADIVGFTRMTEELSPVETVKILNASSRSSTTSPTSTGSRRSRPSATPTWRPRGWMRARRSTTPTRWRAWPSRCRRRSPSTASAPASASSCASASAPGPWWRA
jgi:hypothetical protein